jgi:hypothetical protein
VTETNPGPKKSFKKEIKYYVIFKTNPMNALSLQSSLTGWSICYIYKNNSTFLRIAERIARKRSLANQREGRHTREAT